MTDATDIKQEIDDVIDEIGETVTLYNPTIAYNDEGDVSSYTLGTGSSTTMIVTEDRSGTSYSGNIEGVADNLSLNLIVKSTDSIDNETIVKYGSDYFRPLDGNKRLITFMNVQVFSKLIVSKMLPQEVSKIV